MTEIALLRLCSVPAALVEEIRLHVRVCYLCKGSALALEGGRFANPKRLFDSRRCDVAWVIVERCIRFAFELAQSRARKHLTLVHKTNVLTFAGDLWQRTFDEVAAEFSDVGTAYNHVDAACIYFVQDPGRYDVIVTDNLFGDILTDLGGAVSGGIGRAASANLNPARTGPSLFEPVHGSAPDIAGTGKADPRAAVVSAAMMLEFLGEDDAARRVRAAVDKSADVVGTTPEIGDAIAAAL